MSPIPAVPQLGTEINAGDFAETSTVGPNQMPADPMYNSAASASIDAERLGIERHRERIAKLKPGSAERLAEERVLALSLNSLSLAETARALGKPAGSDDMRQPPKRDVLDAIRSLMMAPVADHRSRRKP